jgi:hypothetical protein
MEQIRVVWNWLISEAGAGWIVAIGTAIAWLLERRRRERPPRVIIQEVARTRVLDIHPSQQHKISVRYNHQDTIMPITEMEQREFVIYNAGTSDIVEPVQFTLVFEREDEAKKRYGIYDWSFDTFDYKITGIPDDAVVGYEIEFPYLNSYHLHKSVIRAYLVTDGDVDIELFIGGGKGWSAYLVTELQLKQMYERYHGLYLRFLKTSFWASVLVGLLIGVLENSKYGFLAFFCGLVTMAVAALVIITTVLDRQERVAAKELGILPASTFN